MELFLAWLVPQEACRQESDDWRFAMDSMPWIASCVLGEAGGWLKENMQRYRGYQRSHENTSLTNSWLLSPDSAARANLLSLHFKQLGTPQPALVIFTLRATSSCVGFGDAALEVRKPCPAWLCMWCAALWWLPLLVCKDRGQVTFQSSQQCSISTTQLWGCLPSPSLINPNSHLPVTELEQARTMLLLLSWRMRSLLMANAFPNSFQIPPSLPSHDKMWKQSLKRVRGNHRGTTPACRLSCSPVKEKAWGMERGDWAEASLHEAVEQPAQPGLTRCGLDERTTGWWKLCSHWTSFLAFYCQLTTSVGHQLQKAVHPYVSIPIRVGWG